MTQKTATGLSFWSLAATDLHTPPHNLASSAHSPSPLSAIRNFLRVPLEFEALVTLGFLSCIDSLLHLLTLYPLRLLTLLSTLRLRTFAVECVPLFLTLASYLCLDMLDFSRSYHFVRGESTLKLYVLYNTLDVFDRLLVSFGHDALAAPAPLLLHVAASLGYTLLHTAVLFFQVVTLHVSLNTSNNALLTLLISANFVELKGTVFKKADTLSIVQTAWADIAERVQLAIFAAVIAGHQARDAGGAGSWGWIGTIFVAELLVDWTKHCFVTRYNNKPASTYRDGLYALGCELLRAPSLLHASVGMERRVGFVRIPLLALLLRVLVDHQLPHVWWAGGEAAEERLVALLVWVLVWVLLVLAKVLLGLVLYVAAMRVVQKNAAACGERAAGLENCYRFVMLEKRIS